MAEWQAGNRMYVVGIFRKQQLFLRFGQPATDWLLFVDHVIKRFQLGIVGM